MHATLHGERTLTDLDFARLATLLRGPVPTAFADMLHGSAVTHPRDIPVDVVTMGSRLEMVDLDTSSHRVLTLCHPREAEPAAGFISVLSPVGSSVLGLRVHDVATWTTPGGETHAARIVAPHFQPERSGDFTR